jgi:hypothetical protein
VNLDDLVLEILKLFDLSFPSVDVALDTLQLVLAQYLGDIQLKEEYYKLKSTIESLVASTPQVLMLNNFFS